MGDGYVGETYVVVGQGWSFTVESRDGETLVGQIGGEGHRLSTDVETVERRLERGELVNAELVGEVEGA